jgi:DNA-binding transcriptional MerR regulator
MSVMTRYTIGDIAEALDLEPSTIRAYKSRKQMPAPTGHIGTTPYWDAEDIEPWIEDRKKVPTP